MEINNITNREIRELLHMGHIKHLHLISVRVNDAGFYDQNCKVTIGFNTPEWDRGEPKSDNRFSGTGKTPLAALQRAVNSIAQGALELNIRA